MKIKRILLLLILTLLFMGISYATEISNDTISLPDTTDKVDEAVQSSNTQIKEVNNTLTDEINTKKLQNKTNAIETDTSISFDIDDFYKLQMVLSVNYDNIKVNIDSDILLRDKLSFNKAIKTLTINGNGKTINGCNMYQFLETYLDSTVIIENIKIINCYSEHYGGALYNQGSLTLINTTLYNNNAQEGGGAIYTARHSNLTIVNSTLYNNTAICGGAIDNRGCSTLNNAKLINNTADYGGAIHNIYNSIIINSLLYNNTAYNGGALENKAILTIINTSLNNNTAYHGGAIRSRGNLTLDNNILNNNKAVMGEAIYCLGNLTFNNNTINNNTVENNKTVLHLTSSCMTYDVTDFDTFHNALINDFFDNITINIKSNIILKDNTIIHDYIKTININGNGKIINGNDKYQFLCVDYSSVIINNITITNCYNQYGGAIYNFGGNITISNVTLNKNNARELGGAICNRRNLIITNTRIQNCGASGGGAIVNYAGNLTLKNSTFYNNYAYYGAAVYTYRSSTIIEDNVFIANMANRDGKAIETIGKATISNNTNAETSKYSGTICADETNVQITNNIFYDENVFINSMNVINDKYVITTKVTYGNYGNANSGRVSYTLDGKWKGSINVVNGSSWISFNIPSIGNHTIVATYINPKGISIASDTYTFEKKNNVNTLFNQFSIKKNKVIIVTTVKDDNGNNVTGGKISYRLNNKWIGSIDVKNGSSWISFNYNDSVVTFKATYINDNNVTENIYTRTLNLTQLKSLTSQKSSNQNNTQLVNNSGVHVIINSMNLLNGKYVITTKVTDDKYVKLGVGRVSYTLNGKWIGSINVVNGSSWISFNVPALGNHTLIATYIDANGKSITKDIYTFVKQSSVAGVNSLFNQYNVKNGKVIIVTAVKNDKSNPINSGRISYSVNGKWIGSVDVKNGSSRISFNYTDNVVAFKATFITNSNVTQNIYTRILDLDEIARLKQS